MLMPNIANKTMLGAGTTARGDTGGANSRTIATANLPAHTHSINHDHASVGTGWFLGSTAGGQCWDGGPHAMVEG